VTYTVGTSLGRLREYLGDTDATDHVFSDGYLNDLLDTYGTVTQAAVVALRRLLFDVRLLRKKFSGTGTLGLKEIAELSRTIKEQIAVLEGGFSDLHDASTTTDMFPEADETEIGVATDEDGQWHRSDVSDYLLNLKLRR